MALICHVSPQANHRGLEEGTLRLAHLPPESREIQSQAVPDWLMRYVISLRQHVG